MFRPINNSPFLIRLAIALLATATVAGISFAQQAEPAKKQTADSSKAPAETESNSKEVPVAEKTEADKAKPEEPPQIKLPPPPPKTGPKVPFELQLYDVELPIVFQPSPVLGKATRASIIAELRELIDRSVGPMWKLKIEEPDWITPRNRTGLERLTSDKLKQRAIELRFVEAVREQLAEYTRAKPAAEGSTSPPDDQPAEDTEEESPAEGRESAPDDVPEDPVVPFQVEGEPPSDEMLAEVRQLLTITENDLFDRSL